MKTPKVKKRAISKNSRAARRGEDSAPNVTSQINVEETDYKPWLHRAQDAGISKKKKSKVMSRQQKLRQQKGLENADRNADKLEKKVAESKARGKKIKARSADWEDLKGQIPHGELPRGNINAAKDIPSEEVKFDEDMTLSTGTDSVTTPANNTNSNSSSQLPVADDVADEVT